MARRRAARGPAGGGGRIQAARPARARVATAAGGLALAGALAAYPPVVADRAPELPAALGAGAVLWLAVALAAGWPSGVAWVLAGLGAAYAIGLLLRGDGAVDAAAPLFGGGLLVLGELSYWSLELRGPGREETRVLLHRFAALAVVAAAAVAVGVFVVAVSAAPLGGGLVWHAVGVAAAAATLALLARLALRGERGGQ